MKPTFFIIGAPKCGTTSLAYWLSQTPSVFMSDPKEPHFYSSDYKQTWNNSYNPQVDDYEALFAGAGPEHKAIGEGSTNYLWSRDAVPRILADIPDARFIVCLRNPADMARSMHAHHLYHGLENIACFERAWRAQPSRLTGRNIPPWMPNPAKLQYGEACKIGSQLERAMTLIAPERVHLTFIEDLAQAPQQTYQEVIDFIGADPAEVSFESRNVTLRRRSSAANQLARAIRHYGKGHLPHQVLTAVQRFNRKHNTTASKAPAPRPEFRAELVEFFRPEVEKLEAISGRDLSAWKPC